MNWQSLNLRLEASLVKSLESKDQVFSVLLSLQELESLITFTKTMTSDGPTLEFYNRDEEEPELEH